MINPNDPFSVSRQLMADRNTVPMVRGLMTQTADKYQSPPVLRPPEQAKPAIHTAPMPSPQGGEPMVGGKPQQPTTPMPRPNVFQREWRQRALDWKMRRRFGMVNR